MKTTLTLAALLSFAGFAAAQPRPPADMLAARVAELERRVGALEQRAGIKSPSPWPSDAGLTTIAETGPAVLGSRPTVLSLRPVSPTVAQAAAPQATFSPAQQWVDPGATYAPQTYAPAFGAPLYTSFGSGDGCVTNADGSVTCGASAAGGAGGYRFAPFGGRFRIRR